MKTPPLLTRLLGNPVVAVFMCGWFLNTVRGYYLHKVGMPGLLFVGFVAAFSAASRRTMRAHKAWLRQWNDTGRMDAGTPARISAGSSGGRRKSALMFFLPVLGLMLLLMAASNARPDELPMLRVLSLGCVVWLVILALARKFRKHGGGQASNAAKVETPSAVAWVAGPARFAPSRAFAISNLPDYALAAMGLRRVDE